MNETVDTGKQLMTLVILLGYKVGLGLRNILSSTQKVKGSCRVYRDFSNYKFHDTYRQKPDILILLLNPNF